MKTVAVTAILALMLAGLYAHADDTDSADADYCHCTDRKEGKARLLLVKGNNSLRPIVLKNTLKSLCSMRYSIGLSTSTYIVLTDNSGKVFASFNQGYAQRSSFGSSIGGMDTYYAQLHKEKVFDSPPKLEVDIPDELEAWTSEKKDWRQFKDKIVDARAEVRYDCKPEFDSTYQYSYRVKIVGECDSATIVRHQKERP